MSDKPNPASNDTRSGGLRDIRPPPDFAAIFRSVPSLYLLLSPDLQIIDASESHLAATMMRREDIVGLNVFEAFPDNPDDPAATGVQNLRASLQWVLDRREAHAMDIQKYDVRRPAGQGGEFEERYWSPSNWPVLNRHGSVHVIIHRVEDVTDLLRLREAGSQMELELFARSRRLAEVTEPARIAAAEYRRALRDYTQLMRHRLANPLTAITGGIATLRDLDLDLGRETRLDILDAMGDVAARLERAILHPESLDDVEGSCLDGVPDLDGHVVDERGELDAVRSELTFREINHHMVDLLDDQSPGRVIDFFCECWSPHCTTRLQLPLAEYFAVHAHHDQFVICPEHELPTVEHVIDKRDTWWVVRKFKNMLERLEQSDAAPDAARLGVGPPDGWSQSGPERK